MSQDLRSELAPTGTLRAGLNMANFLLISGRTADGDPEGVGVLSIGAELALHITQPQQSAPFIFLAVALIIAIGTMNATSREPIWSPSRAAVP